MQSGGDPASEKNEDFVAAINETITEDEINEFVTVTAKVLLCTLVSPQSCISV